MRKYLLPILIFLFTIKCVLAASFTVSVIPSNISASKETQLTFIFTNLNDTQNITELSITIPSGFSLGQSSISISPSEGRSCTVYLPIIKCSGTPFIESNLQTNISFSIIADVASPPEYQFYFIALDTSNQTTSNSINITVNDIDSPVILSVFPGNISVKYKENGIYIFNASFYDNVKINSVEFFWNDVLEQINYTNSKNFSLQIIKEDLAVGNYNYSWRVNDSSGNSVFLVYFFNVTQAENPLTFYINNQKNQNITVENGTSVNITIIAKGVIYVWLNNAPLGISGEGGTFNTSYPFASAGLYRIFANATGNQNYTANSTGASFFVKVIYPRPRFKDLQAPSSVTYSPGATYTFKITFYSPSYPINNITNVSFVFDNQVYYLPINNPQNDTYTFTVKDLAAGSYNWLFCANDTQGESNCTSGTLTISQAKPNLDIINVQDYLAPVNKTIVGVGCPPQLVCKLYLNDSELPNKFYELNTDKGGYYIFTFNTSGNANYSATSITKTMTVYPPKQSTTKETVSSTTTTTTLVSQQPLSSQTTNIRDVQANVPAIFKINNQDLYKVTEIEITATENIKNVEVRVDIPLPIEISTNFVEKNKVFLTYLKITTNISSEKIANAKIRFKVEKTWVNVNNIDPSKVFLYKLVNGNWIQLPTQKITEDNNNIYYESTLNSFSIFVIAGEIKAGFPWNLALIPIVIIVVAVIAYLFWPTPMGSEYERLKQKWSK